MRFLAPNSVSDQPSELFSEVAKTSVDTAPSARIYPTVDPVPVTLCLPIPQSADNIWIQFGDDSEQPRSAIAHPHKILVNSEIKAASVTLDRHVHKTSVTTSRRLEKIVFHHVCRRSASNTCKEEQWRRSGSNTLHRHRRFCGDIVPVCRIAAQELTDVPMATYFHCLPGTGDNCH
jgi:hypothetical protein